MEKGFRIESAVVDTGIIYALADTKDSWHERAVDFVEAFDGRLIIPSTIIPEACYLLNTFLGQSAETGFINSLLKRELTIEHFKDSDLARCVELLKKYGDSNIGFVDASLIAVAERLKIPKIITTDRRHFSIIRPAHCKAFQLLP